MSKKPGSILNCPPDTLPDGHELIEAAMQWHFDPRTGCKYWLERAKSLAFDPVTDIRTFGDLKRFPNVVNELRDVPAEDLVPRGLESMREVLGVFESGGTTGAPKRVICTHDWMNRWLTWNTAQLEKRGLPRNAHWLGMMPSGPHIFGAALREQASRGGGLLFTIDMDPRWVKKCIAEGRTEEAGRYADHLIKQTTFLLKTQKIGVLVTTPPLLDRLARNEQLVELIRNRVRFIQWGGAHMDADTRRIYRTQVFPGLSLQGAYGSTMVLGGTVERMGLKDDDPCVFDPFAPYISFSVVDPKTKENVEYGQRGQVVMNHISKGMFLPNNLERDMATRIRPPSGQMGDSVADVSPVAQFDNETVIEGVY